MCHTHMFFIEKHDNTCAYFTHKHMKVIQQLLNLFASKNLVILVMSINIRASRHFMVSLLLTFMWALLWCTHSSIKNNYYLTSSVVISTPANKPNNMHIYYCPKTKEPTLSMCYMFATYIISPGSRALFVVPWLYTP